MAHKIRKSNFSKYHSDNGLYATTVCQFDKSSDGKFSRNRQLRYRPYQIDPKIEITKEIYFEITYQLTNRIYFPLFLSFEHDNVSAVSILTTEPTEFVNDRLYSLTNILKQSFGDLTNHKIINVYDIYDKFYKVKNVNALITNSRGSSPKLDIKYTTPNFKHFYVNHRISYLFDNVNFAEKIKTSLSNMYDFYHIFDDVRDIFKNLDMGSIPTTNVTFIESDISTFNYMHRFFDQKLYNIYSNITNEEVKEFRDSFKNIDASNVNNTLTIKGVKFFPNPNTNTVDIYIPIFNNYSMYIDEFKFAYAWVQRFGKLDNVSSYVNKIRIMAL